jgi:hypothetical protein
LSATATKKDYRLVKKIKDDKFDVDELHQYILSLSVGIRDFQLCITNSTNNRVLLLEDFRLEDIRTVNSRIRALKHIYENHHLLKAGFWKEVKIALKTHKFTLVPNNYFIAESASDYLAVNNPIKTNIEEVYYYKHLSSDEVNVFASDGKLINWFKKIYKNTTVGLIHQGSALIEGILHHDDLNHEKTMFGFFDRRIMHLVGTDKNKLIFYNQFSIRQEEDYIKYMLLAMRELKMSQKSTKVVLWGNLKHEGKQIELLKKYIRNISFGGRPKKLKFGYQFDEIIDHQYFDLLNIYFCE